MLRSAVAILILSANASLAQSEAQDFQLPDDLAKKAETAIAGYRSYFDSLDVDRSGRITRDELRAASEKRHSGYDANADGYVSAEEYASRDGSLSPARAARYIRKIDSDNDNRISRTEAQREALQVLRFDADRSKDLTFAEILLSAPPVVKRYYDQQQSNKR